MENLPRLAKKSEIEWTLEDKQIIILNLLKTHGALITPVKTHDFQDKIDSKIITPEEFKVCWETLEKRDFIKTISSARQSAIFLTWLTSAGYLEIDNYEKTLFNEEIKKYDHSIKKRSNKFFYLSLGISLSAVIVAGIVAWINYTKVEYLKQKLQYLESKVKSTEAIVWYLERKQMDDPIRTSTISIQKK